MDLVRVSAVKYINTYPFIYGLKDSEVLSMIELEVCHPSECAKKLLNGQTDVGLVPVAALSRMSEYHILSDYCIGTQGRVKTVLLVGNTPPENCHSIYLDHRSRSSVTLCRIMAEKFWKRSYRWIPASKEFDVTTLAEGESAVIIGDQCFQYENEFKFVTDLGLEWNRHTGLPFVFACWASSKRQNETFTRLFNKALSFGVENKYDAVSLLQPDLHVTADDVADYYRNNIDFVLDEPKKEAMSLFIRYIKELNIVV